MIQAKIKKPQITFTLSKSLAHTILKKKMLSTENKKNTNQMSLRVDKNWRILFYLKDKGHRIANHNNFQLNHIALNFNKITLYASKNIIEMNFN